MTMLITENELLSAAITPEGRLTWTRENGDIIDAGIAVGPAVTDADMATIAADAGSSFAGQLSATYAAERVTRRGSTRTAVESAPGTLRRVTLGAEMPMRDLIPLYTDGYNYVSPFDVASMVPAPGASFYMHTRGTSANTGLALGTLTNAIPAGTVTSLPITASATTASVGFPVIVIFGEEEVGLFMVATAVTAGDTTVTVTGTANQSIPVGARVISPKQNLTQCFSAAAAGDEIVLLDDFNFRTNTLQTTITKSIRIRGLRPDTRVTVSDDVTWSLTAGTASTYQAARTNVRQIINMGSFSRDGIELTRVTTLAEVETTPGSWYQASDGTGNVYLRTFNGTKPDNREYIALLAVEHFRITGGATDLTVYFENLTIIGGYRGIEAEASSGGALTRIAKNCRFLWGGYGNVGAAVHADLFNGLSARGTVYSLMQNVICAHSGLDNFNYHWVSGSPLGWGVEIDCEGHSAAINAISTAVGVQFICNASTSHDGIKVLRVNSLYHDTYGAVIADIMPGTVTEHYGCKMWGSHAPSGWFNASVSAQDIGADIRLFGCDVFGSEFDIVCVNGATVTGDSVQYDTVGGYGVANIVITNRR